MKKKMGILSLTVSIAAWVVGLASLVVVGLRCDSTGVTTVYANGFMIGAGVVPFVLGAAAIILGIWSMVKRQKNKAIAVIGILFAAPVVLWGGLMICECLIGITTPSEMLKVFLEGVEGALN